MLAKSRVEESGEVLKPLFCGYLQPLDLLHLARTSSALRQAILSKAAKQLWIRSFSDLKQKGFPDCPADLSEPQYVNLVLSVYCHNCLRDDGDTAYYLIILGRTRLCFNCARKSYVPLNIGRRGPKLSPPEILRYIPYTELTFTSSSPSQVSPHDLFGSQVRFRDRKYSVNDIRAMTQEYRALGKDHMKKEAWRKAHEERRQILSSHATAWAEYEIVWLREQQEAKQALTDARIVRALASSTRQKLVDAGWEEELVFLETFAQPTTSLGCGQFHWRKFEGVAKPALLTEEEWRKLHIDLEPWFKGTREERLYQEKASAVKARVQEHVESLYRDFILSKSGDDPFPSIAEVCLIPEFCTLLEEVTVEVTPSMLDTAAAALSDFVQEWRRDRKEELLKIMRKSNAYSSSKLSPTAESLRCASTIFKCDLRDAKTHREPCTIAYPEVLVHPCWLVRASVLQLPRPRPADGPQKGHGGIWKKAKDQRAGISTTPKPPSKAGDLIRTALADHLVFVPKGVNFGDATFVHTEALLELCKPPSTTTVEELQKADPHVATKCGCFSPDLLLRWASATRMTGSKTHHRRPTDPKRIFSLPSEQYQAMIQGMQTSRRDNQDRESQYYCVLCSQLVPNTNGVDHFRVRHKMSTEAAAQFLSRTLVGPVKTPDVSHHQKKLFPGQGYLCG